METFVRVLVAYGSKMGGTQGLAEMLGAELADLGIDAEVRPAKDVHDVGSYDAVVVGGALYHFVSWHKDAKTLVKRLQTELRQRPVWLFSSGPLDESAAEKDIPPIKSVRKLMERVGARGHATFGGLLEEKSGNLPVGDWRDPAHVRRWAQQIADELSGGSAAE